MVTELSGSQKTKSFSLICHKALWKKLKICGFGRNRTSSTITAVFENISSPTSIYDIAFRETWSSLPIELLLLAFSNYSEFDDVLLEKKKPSLEFLVVPKSPQLPPFFLRKPSSRSSKWSKKEQPGVELVGPVVPLPVLLTLHKFRNGCLNSEQEYSPEAELSNRCSQNSKVTRDITNSAKQKKAFIAYNPITKPADFDQHQQELTTFVSRVRNDGFGERTWLELFNDMSPVEICFENRTADFDKTLFTSKTLLSRVSFSVPSP
ncbi:unnamed protein product [Arabis nemorensis]|uniref:Uncharacterized protein n=1 Tax=Arabis nemorensis TaxID=586526 RepID=A0A565AVT5_9BRAS|nr:unnamed protein product [Arabis nemorensis]